ncbi:peptidase [Malaciobacter mytili LMG 24559]|uniref:Peptidase n=1 Tax=Malaciobacter mytili LMG 24559 TaxID=1032238 RepID=A0AAX2AHA3_9BACT|nr:M15 family peptidase [Malaciobacter mytili]AXH14260.1 peptidase, M15 family [Malaciobacter mytili LMG 24559]RXK15298.1 peptidase [Malaciobacter mytili LMG 24559]
MPSFGKTSIQRLETCHKDLQTICNEVIKYYDFSVIEGYRTLEMQQKYFKDGKSKLDGINQKSKHQSLPSLAVDVAPYPIDFKNEHKAKARFYHLAGYMFMASEILYKEKKITHKLRWGGDWDIDNYFNDQSFDDLPHFELVKV